MKDYFVFLLVIFKMSSAEAPLFQNHWIIWNIGQGQWVTHVASDTCTHFDAGGEAGTFKRIRAKLVVNCGRKHNRLVLSHWDTDHFLHIPFLAKTVARLCWLFKPRFGSTKVSAQKILSLKIKDCGEEISFSTTLSSWLPEFARTTNESSAVFIFNSVLLPGDSPTAQEKLWSAELPGLESAKVLILGHHGSRTSTGEELMTRLTGLKWAAASARWVKYRHPHDQTLKRIYKNNIPVIRTEDWGNIWFTN